MRQWPAHRPRDPLAWLATVARHRVVDGFRSDAARRAREDRVVAVERPGAQARHLDDSLDLLMLCCHPKLTPSAQVVLTLRSVAGLSTAQIAHALLKPEPTAGQRVSRAKASLRAAGGTFPRTASAERADSVLRVLYLMHTAGHTATAGSALYDPDLTAEAVRLARLRHAALRDHTEAAGLLALMLLTDARRGTRVDEHGAMVPLDEQDRSRWDHAKIGEGTRLLRETLPGAAAGPYLLQAAIAALHDEAADTERTDWQEIVILYKLLEHQQPNPVTTLNRAVAEAMVHGPQAGLHRLAEIEAHAALTRSHHLLAVRAHLLDRAGDQVRARRDYLAAARLTLNLTEQRYLRGRVANLRCWQGPATSSSADDPR